MGKDSKDFSSKYKRAISYILISLLLSSILYWPIFKIIPIEDSNSTATTTIAVFNFPTDPDLLSSLGITLPVKTHSLCLINNNRVYLISSLDSRLRSSDISRTPEAKDNGVGSMQVDLNYDGNLSPDPIYAKIGQWFRCVGLDGVKIKKLASSTITYRTALLVNEANFDIENVGTFKITQPIEYSYINTSLSLAFISARWVYFVGTFIVILLLISGLHGLLFQRRSKSSQNYSLEDF